ncbi:hypothetical protein LTR94_037978, partial [Friedmanniomyces endolithicus]
RQPDRGGDPRPGGARRHRLGQRPGPDRLGRLRRGRPAHQRRPHGTAQRRSGQAGGRPELRRAVGRLGRFGRRDL